MNPKLLLERASLSQSINQSRTIVAMLQAGGLRASSR